jgi:hypothetical protein
MSIAENSPPELAPPSTKRQSAWRVLAIAVGWLLVATCVAVAAGFLVGFFKGFAEGFLKGFSRITGISIATDWLTIDPPTFRFTFTEVGYFGFAITLLVAAARRARLTGQGDVRAGLGNGPTANHVALIGIAILILAADIGSFYYFRANSDPSAGTFSKSFGLNMLAAFNIVALAPLAEELFFRG